MTTLASPAPGRTAAPAGPGWGPLLVVLAGTFITLLDFFIVNVALPSIQAELHAGPAVVQLVVAGYGLSFATGMISGGRLGDLYGRRRMFSIGLALFTLTSAACGLAPSAGFLVVARILQGAAGALLTPQVLAILGTTYDGARRGRAFAAYGLAMGFAGVLGQLLGGALIAADIAGSGWRGIFLINVPVGLVALALTRRVVPESHGQQARLDLAGTLLATGGLTAIILPLIEGQQHGWPLWTWLSLAAAPVLLGGFAVHQLHRRSAGRAPLVDFGLFRSRTFGLGSLAALAYALVPPAFFFVLALYLQDGRGFSALFSGLVFAAVGAGFFAAMLTAGAMAARLGRQILALGALVTAAGCLLLAAGAGGASSAELLPGLAVVGFGIGMVLVPLSAAVLRDVEARHAGAASGVLATFQQVGGALGVAVIGVIFYRGLHGGTFPHAFTISLCVLAALTLLTAGLVQALPRGSAR
ncbi:MAG TPA: MFS transporter [Streptosporangiaceae bacterium]|jgi:EmrB/QacA subfamily drug resistance transporter